MQITAFKASAIIPAKSRILICAMLSVLLIPMVACEKPAPVSIPPAPVEVAQVATADVPLEIHSIGTVEAVESVDVSSQVGGYLQDVYIREGQAVKEGQLLFRIDSRKYEVTLKQNEAALKQTEIQWKNAIREAQRAEALLKDNAVTPQDRDKLQAAAEALEAAVRLQEAAIESTRLDLSFCTIRAPISGRAGALLAHKGDLIKAGSTVFVSVKQMSPINVRFSVPEKDLAALRAAMDSGDLKVTAVPPQNGGAVMEGRLVFIDNTVDVQTGSIILKAEFANESETLWPGQFVETSLLLGSVRDALVIPSVAVQTGQQGAFVFVINAQSRAEIRSIVTGAAYDGSVVVTDGLQAGETVVTDGQIRLGQGTEVRIRKPRTANPEKSE